VFTDECFCEIVAEEINISVISSPRKAVILEMNWEETDAGETEADVNNVLIYMWVMSLFNTGMLLLRTSLRM
jgi:hypothetical protein